MTKEFDEMLVGKGERKDLDAESVLDPTKAALIIIDLQYLGACRTTGVGKKFTEEGNAALVAWRFDRLEQKVIPNVQKLLTFLRQNKLKAIYITLGAQTQDYSDVPRHIKPVLQAFNGRTGSRDERLGFDEKSTGFPYANDDEA